MEKTKPHIEFIVIDIQNTFNPFEIPVVRCNFVRMICFWPISTNGFCLLADIKQCQYCHLKRKLNLTSMLNINGSNMTLLSRTRGWQYVRIFGVINFQQLIETSNNQKVLKETLFEFSLNNSIQLNFKSSPVAEMVDGLCT